MYHDTTQLEAPSPSTGHGPGFWMGTTLLAIILAVAVGAGAFFVGQGTRDSEAKVADRLEDQSSRDRLGFEQRLEGALTSQREELTKSFRKRLKRAKESAFASGQEAGYSTGYSSGTVQGQAEGREEGRAAGVREGREEGELEGYLEGFDEGTCYDPVTYEYVC